jgi:hypothetical protein
MPRREGREGSTIEDGGLKIVKGRQKSILDPPSSILAEPGVLA